MIRPDASPYHSTIIVDQSSGGRVVLPYKHGATYPRPEDICRKWVWGCGVLFVDHLAVDAALHAASLARSRGIPVVADIERIPDGRVLDLIKLVDHLIVGVELGRHLTGCDEPKQMVEVLADPARVCCVVTAGRQGCWYSESGGSPEHLPAFDVPVVDTTGCGDVFHGAYAAGIAAGHSVVDSIRQASAAAALKATQPGGRQGIPDQKKLHQFLTNHQD